ncbi:SDR family NAD(P)-dependent oxidoreductase [Enterovibrio coralii]|uniref:Short-chain dehydrogenase n=1 Tax=Enterovibrio coralii TaxID=294935 RepID=A0A135IAB7_9GAMM|nr:SDR family oxidoreductase [Enterovibrio coralii]KXF82389.1 short-chain dehydrogenase [Enterovibrio coralii]
MYKNKVVVITGGSGGIGAELVKAYAELDATVICLDIVGGDYKRCHYFLTDLGKKEEVVAAFATIKAQFGAVHVLINNGAISTFNKPVDTLTPEEFANVINVNLVGAFTCVSEFISANEGQDYGRIVNISSTRWHQNEAGWEAYGASKGGLVSLTNSLVVSLSNTPITVNVVSPGWIQSADYDALRDIDHKQHPSGRVGRPKDIVNACQFLTHPDNDFVNGANILVDGGMTKKMIYQD